MRNVDFGFQRILLAFGWDMCFSGAMHNNERTRRLANRFKCRKFVSCIRHTEWCSNFFFFSLLNRSAWSMVNPLYVIFEWMRSKSLLCLVCIHDKPKKIWKHFHLTLSLWRRISCATNNIVVCFVFFFLFFIFCTNLDSLIVWVFCCNSSEWCSK